MTLGFPYFSRVKAAAAGVKAIWDRSTFRTWVVTSLGTLVVFITQVPAPMTWSVCWRTVAGTGIATLATLFVMDDSAPPPPPAPAVS